ncbi:hypothetical protein PV327_005015 [Microctonus hyperodae]|uniref:Uncharacterized protein n=1 Tax=Microctonus hyperodae TaxID=165561 RepID=A0AA39FE06_MICHY|nr:hypothetical protein PV327_005015 [Microctonus hyperodae]
MSTFINTFETTNHHDFNWPYPRSLMIIPSQPSKNNGLKLYLPRPDSDKYNCNVHNHESDYFRYKKFSNQRSPLRNNINVNHEMSAFLSEMLDNDNKPEIDIMKSIYQISHKHSDPQIVEYTSLIAKLDSPIESFRKPAIREIKNSHRNPHGFQFAERDMTHIHPTETVDLTRTPEVFLSWDRPNFVRSEYMDTISKFGINNLKNHSQYLEPIPSSRRRKGNRNP